MEGVGLRVLNKVRCILGFGPFDLGGCYVSIAIRKDLVRVLVSMQKQSQLPGLAWVWSLTKCDEQELKVQAHGERSIFPSLLFQVLSTLICFLNFSFFAIILATRIWSAASSLFPVPYLKVQCTTKWSTNGTVSVHFSYKYIFTLSSSFLFHFNVLNTLHFKL